jgi:hypothetical protein
MVYVCVHNYTPKIQYTRHQLVYAEPPRVIAGSPMPIPLLDSYQVITFFEKRYRRIAMFVPSA